MAKNENIRIYVHDTADALEMSEYDDKVREDWCKCGKSEFLCYPEDGACACGVFKHHVHCKNCGGIMQVG